MASRAPWYCISSDPCLGDSSIRTDRKKKILFFGAPLWVGVRASAIFPSPFDNNWGRSIRSSSETGRLLICFLTCSSVFFQLSGIYDPLRIFCSRVALSWFCSGRHLVIPTPRFSPEIFEKNGVLSSFKAPRCSYLFSNFPSVPFVLWYIAFRIRVHG